jgi:creatinine amidohydrolase/Fe(II)-dependent formamide hydrolase-like protein
VKEVLNIDEMTRDEITEKISDSLVIIPVGAIEQHGSHLPNKY